VTDRLRPAWAEIDLDAVRANVAELARLAAPAALLAVVKADGYGHGSVPVARAALDAGATWLGVALVEEGIELRDAGIDVPILVLSEPVPGAADAVVRARLTPAVYTPGGIESLAKAVAGSGAPRLGVHLKVDTGMHRVGAAPEDAAALVARIEELDELELSGFWTHFAVADEPSDPYTAQQLQQFKAVLATSGAAPTRPLIHAANSAALLAHPDSRFDLVRTGIAIYGIPPAPILADRAPLQPALSLKTRVSHVKTLAAGERLSYGLRYELARPSRIATVPIGYADGVPRNLGAVGGQVLVHGARHPIAGTVTMDQLMVDVGDENVSVGDEVVLIGRQGTETVTAEEWAERMGTIGYEIVCAIGARVPRIYTGSGA
jgi:alanine racemase